jgi:hypothetical protein
MESLSYASFYKNYLVRIAVITAHAKSLLLAQ